MLHITQIDKFRQQRDLWRQQQRSVALVPTMGNLHSGHLKLVKKARELADVVVVTIYVNPMQFGANEDLDNYPRTLTEDLAALRELGVDAVLTPPDEAVYPRGLADQTRVEVPGISDILCGASRPGHFRGVATIVCKLFNMVQPQAAVFGEKDFQQLQVIRNMVQDLSMPVVVHGVATEREESGLAKSSRNGYLSDDEKARAAVLYQQLQKAAAEVRAHPGQITAIERQAHEAIREAGLEVEYFSVRATQDLSLPDDPRAQSLVILVAARLGTTRLIDNIRV
ncbi:pantoate--beta-alanine ligase [Aliidiomarina sp. Khilg15.8]